MRFKGKSMGNTLEEAIDEISCGYFNKNIKNAGKNMSNRYNSSFNGGMPLVNKMDEVVAYTLSRMSATNKVAEFVLTKIKENIETVLDLGAGTGSATFAALNMFQNASVCAVEKVNKMQSLHKTIAFKMGQTDRINFLLDDAANFNSNNKFQLVMASYLFNELNKEDQKIVLNKMYEFSTDYIVIIEPGTPKNYSQMMSIKQEMLNLGAKLISPCKTINCCLKEGDWCHFLVRVQRSKAHKEIKQGSLNYEDEKFTYLIFKKDNNIQNDKENIIIRRPVFGKKKISLKVCSPSGVQEKVITNSNNSNYKAIKKLGVGDEF